MTLQHNSIRLLAAAAVLCTAGAAQATITFVNSVADPAFANRSTDTFSDLTINTNLGTVSLVRTTGTLPYVLSTTVDNLIESSLYTVPVAGTRAVSTGFNTDALLFNLLPSTITAFGGNFFATNVLGEFAGNTGLTITVTDVAGLSFTQAVTPANAAAFSGFVSTIPLRFASVRITTPNTNVWATVDNVALVAVPEPGTWSLFLAGGALALRLGARRRND